MILDVWVLQGLILKKLALEKGYEKKFRGTIPCLLTNITKISIRNIFFFMCHRPATFPPGNTIRGEIVLGLINSFKIFKNYYYCFKFSVPSIWHGKESC